MSTIQDKKAALLAKIARQKAKQKEQTFTIPNIKLSAKEKQHKAKKTFIPTTQSLAKKSKTEDSMREFLAEVDKLKGNDFVQPQPYTNKIVYNGHQLYIKTYVKDAILAEYDPNADIDVIENQAED